LRRKVLWARIILPLTRCAGKGKQRVSGIRFEPGGPPPRGRGVDGIGLSKSLE
jgi:hypothetical protein